MRCGLTKNNLGGELVVSECDCGSLFDLIFQKTPPPLEGRSTWPVRVRRVPKRLENAVFASKTARSLYKISKNPGESCCQV